MTTYIVENMRVLAPSAKTRESNPELAFTVKGTFYDENGEKLSFSSKPVDIVDVKSEGFHIDIEKGILTLNGGQRGRKPSPSLSSDDLASLLTAIREDATEA